VGTAAGHAECSSSTRVRTLPHIILLLGATGLAAGCSADPGALTGGPPPLEGDPSGKPDDDDDDDAPKATPPPAPPTPPSFSEKTLARARLWIDAKMPYCGGPNHGKDLICGGTCTRTGTAASAEWDPYRSDCSGFVSWSWGLPAPGRTTATLAPKDTTLSVVIAVGDLAPGDALNGTGHVMLWGGWVDEKAGKALILQESRCGTLASEKIATFTKVDASTLQISDGRKLRSIRYKGATTSTK
jgi:hypothetical protein